MRSWAGQAHTNETKAIIYFNTRVLGPIDGGYNNIGCFATKTDFWTHTKSGAATKIWRTYTWVEFIYLVGLQVCRGFSIVSGGKFKKPIVSSG